MWWSTESRKRTFPTQGAVKLGVFVFVGNKTCHHHCWIKSKFAHNWNNGNYRLKKQLSFHMALSQVCLVWLFSGFLLLVCKIFLSFSFLSFFSSPACFCFHTFPPHLLGISPFAFPVCGVFADWSAPFLHSCFITSFSSPQLLHPFSQLYLIPSSI